MTNPFLRIKALKHVIMLSLLFGMLANFSVDLWALRNYKRSERTGQSVVSAAAIQPHLQNLDRSIAELLANPTPEHSKHVGLLIDELELMIDDPEQRDLLAKIRVDVTAGTSQLPDAIELIAKMLMNQAAILNANIAADMAVNDHLERNLGSVIALDALVIFIIAALYFFETAVRKQVETDLVVANGNFEKLIHVLQTRLSDQFEKHKILVHDLKNPLGTIHGFAELIIDESSMNPSIQEFSVAIRRSSEKTLRLVDSILQSPTVSQPARNFEQIDLVELIDEICADFAQKAVLKSQMISFEDGAAHDRKSTGTFLVSGDRLKLEELFGNLLSNALKYSPKGGVVTVRILGADSDSAAGDVGISTVASVARAGGGRAIVEIEDQGAGFTVADVEKAFRLGQTLSAKATGQESSTGYGLFISKQIVELHQGSISILGAKKGPGACLRVELPCV